MAKNVIITCRMGSTEVEELQILKDWLDENSIKPEISMSASDCIYRFELTRRQCSVVRDYLPPRFSVEGDFSERRLARKLTQRQRHQLEKMSKRCLKMAYSVKDSEQSSALIAISYYLDDLASGLIPDVIDYNSFGVVD